MVFERRGRREDLVAAIWEEVREAYDKLGAPHRLNHLKLTTFRTRSPMRPDMKTNAAETRHLVPALAIVAQKRRGNGVEQHCAASLEHLSRFYLLCESQPMFMGTEGAERGKCIRHSAWLTSILGEEV